MRIRGIAMLVGAVLCAAAVPAHATLRDLPPAMPCYAGNPGPETQLLDLGRTGIRWTVTRTRPTGSTAAPPTIDRDLTRPLVSGGVAYVAMEGQLLAVRTADGVTLWNVSLIDSPQQLFVDGSHTVLVGAQTVSAYDSATGRPVWTRAIDGGITTNTALTGQHGLAVSTGHGRTEVINLGTGSVRWTSSTHGGIDPVLATSTTVVRVDPSYLEAFDAATGKRLWHHTSASTPVITGGVVVSILPGKSYGLGGLNLRTGQLRWHSGGFTEPLAAGDGGVLGNTSTQVVFLDPATGKRIWPSHGQVQLNGAQISFSRGVVADVENSANVNQVVGHRITDGKVLWHAPQANDGAIGTGIAPTGNTLLATSEDATAGTGAVTRFDTQTGAVAWKVATPLLSVGPAVADGANAVVLDESLQCGTGVTATVTG